MLSRSRDGTSSRDISWARVARRGRTMHAIQDPELIDRQIVDVVLPQHGPLPTRQCAQRSLERPLELAPVDTLDVIELGVAGMADVPQQLVVLPASLAVGAAAALQR